MQDERAVGGMAYVTHICFEGLRMLLWQHLGTGCAATAGFNHAHAKETICLEKNGSAICTHGLAWWELFRSLLQWMAVS